MSPLLESFLPTFIIRRLSCRGSGTTSLMSNLTTWAQRTSIYCYSAHFHKLNMHKHLIHTQIFNTTAAHGNTASIKCIRSTDLPFHILFSRHSLRCLLLPLGIRYFLWGPLLQKQSIKNLVLTGFHMYTVTCSSAKRVSIRLPFFALLCPSSLKRV